MDNLHNLLISLTNLGCTAIKISFEDEGALLNEIMTMRYLTASTGLKLSIKIGGCEAKRDLQDCIDIQANTVVAPMIESDFALKKFIKTIKKTIYENNIGFNLETIQGYKNFDNILNVLNTEKCIDSIVVGRVDLVNSMNKDREYVDSDEIYEIVENIFIKSKKEQLICNLGGAISINSKNFISKLMEKKIIDYFETRYIIFNIDEINMDNFEKMLYYANLFELEWMKYISNRYYFIMNKDTERIKMIQKRLDNNNINK